MNILVKGRHPFWVDEVTVQIIEDGYVTFCNHAGAETDEVCFNPGLDDERVEKHPVCDKCGAWYQEYDDREGEWYEG